MEQQTLKRFFRISSFSLDLREFPTIRLFLCCLMLRCLVWLLLFAFLSLLSSAIADVLLIRSLLIPVRLSAVMQSITSHVTCIRFALALFL